MEVYYMKFDKELIAVPSWAKWVAQDRDGWWCFYKHKPIQRTKIWLPKDGLVYGDSDWCPARLCFQPKDWTQELYKIYREG